MSDLEDYSKTGGRFFSFEKEKELEMSFKSATKEQDRFGTPGTMTICYRFIDQNGEEREFSSKSKRLAKAMVEAGVTPGDMVRINRVGSGYETMYLVKIVKKKKEPETQTVEEPPVDDLSEGEISDDLKDIDF